MFLILAQYASTCVDRIAFVCNTMNLGFFAIFFSFSFFLGWATFAQKKAKHWSYQPIIDPDVPQTNSSNWGSNEIDAFILAKMERENCKPPVRAEDRILHRRLLYTLTGLPSSSTKNQKFDFEEKLEELLNSPHYGEKWARHWMDVARYADSNGLDENLAFAHAWRYRDYLIDAFNRDVPFDQFITEQLAGDLLSDGKSLAAANRLKVATGFLALGPKLLAEPDPVKMEMDMIDEQLDVVGQAFMAITIGCARCHDHMSDPITTAEYYGMAGIFKSTKSMDQITRPTRWHEHVISSRDEQIHAEKHELLINSQKALIEAYKDKANHELVALKVVQRVPKNPTNFYSESTRREIASLEKILAQYENTRPVLEYCHGVSEGNVTKLKVHLRGDPDTLGEEQDRKFLSLFQVSKDKLPSEHESGRLQLAEWIASPKNPLTARVIVNRVWRWHFGKGLVETTDNFGVLGSKPSHPKLLDWLTSRFIEDGWSIKSLHRRILSSATWQSSSQNHDETMDPRNKLFSRFPIRKLYAEEIRDTWISLSGDLNRSIGGKIFYPENRKHIFTVTSIDDTNYDLNRRSIYLPVIRNHVYDFFQLFDFPDPTIVQGSRKESSTNQQALFFMNSPFSQSTASKIVRKTFSENKNDWIKRIYLLVLGRLPSEMEQLSSESFLRNFPNPKDDYHAATAFTRTMLSCNEFLYLR